MSIHHHAFHDFFRNKEMNGIYLSYGILNFAQGLISVFVPIYLYSLGYSIQAILLFFFLVSVNFLVFSFLGVKMLSHYGIEKTMLLSICCMIFYYLGLRLLPEYAFAIFILPTFRALEMLLYNMSFHANFFEHAERKNLGRQVSASRAAALIGGALAPFVGGFLIAVFGFQLMFIVGSALLFVSLFPLMLLTKHVRKIEVRKNLSLFKLLSETRVHDFLSYSAYAIESWIGMILWPIFLFILLANTESVGILTSLTLVITIVTLAFIGVKTDAMEKRKLLRIGSFFYVIGWAARVFVGGFASVFFVDTYKNLAQYALQVPWSAHFYDSARKRNYFEFIVQRELVFNTVRVAILPALILLFAMAPFPFHTSFSIAAVSSLLYFSVSRG